MSTERNGKKAVASGIVAGIGIFALFFPSLFFKGRIWAEEGTLFLAHTLQATSEPNFSSFIYLQNGHWDLWTNITALIAGINLSGAPLAFTWSALTAHAITAIAMSVYAINTISGQLNHWAYKFCIGLSSFIVITICGGPEVMANTTNTQWILAVYIIFRLFSTKCARGSNIRNINYYLLQAFDLVAIMSSFAGTISYALYVIFRSAKRIFKKNQSILKVFLGIANYNPGISIGFFIQVVSTIILRDSSSQGRTFDFVPALKGFMTQGFLGLLLPANAPLNSIATSIKEGSPISLLFAFLMSAIIFILIYQLVSGQRKILYLILILTFLYCQLALGEKSNLISAGGGMRYFATERVVLTWMLLCSAISTIFYLPLEPKINKVLAAIMPIMILLSSISYFNPSSLSSHGINFSSCRLDTIKTLELLQVKTSSKMSQKVIPICPDGWSVTMPSNTL